MCDVDGNLLTHPTDYVEQPWDWLLQDHVGQEHALSGVGLHHSGGVSSLVTVKTQDAFDANLAITI